MTKKRKDWPRIADFHIKNRGKFRAFLRRKTPTPDPESEQTKVLIEQTWHHKGRVTHLLSLGQRIRELYHSCLGYDDSANWRFKAVLGFGAFGVAALYEQMQCTADGSEHVADELVVKTELPRPHGYINSERQDISKEAYHLAQTNHFEQGNQIVGLRQYKFVAGYQSTVPPYKPFAANPITESPLEEWRSYLEYCRAGTLDSLMSKYAAWGYHFPESFIWHCFRCMALAIVALNTGPFADESIKGMGTLRPDSFLLHNDMKPGNILFGSSEDPADAHIWPVPKVADFGLSQVYGQQDPSNTARTTEPGAQIFLSPEKRQDAFQHVFYPYEDCHYKAPRQANGELVDDRSHPITSASNVFGIGLIIYFLMTFDDPCKFGEFIDMKMEPGSMGFAKGPDHPLFDHDDFPSVATFQGLHYSEDLIKLVIDTTCIRPSARPSAQEVLDRCNSGLYNEGVRLQREFKNDMALIVERIRVNFDHHAWNHTPPGPFIARTAAPAFRPSHESNSGAPEQFWLEFWQDEATTLPDQPALFPPSNTVWCEDDVEPCVYQGQKFAPAKYREVPIFLHQGPKLAAAGRAIAPATLEAVLEEESEKMRLHQLKAQTEKYYRDQAK